MFEIDYINKVIATTEEIVSKYTYPVFALIKNKPDLFASSVVIKLEQKYYLITASHVIIQIITTDNSLTIGVNGKYIPISGEFIYSYESGKDNFDIAYIELNNQFIAEYEIRFLEHRRLLLNSTPESCDIAFIHGYPNSKNKQKKALWNTTLFRAKTYTYAGIIKNDFSKWSDLGKKKENHTCMSYSKKTNGNAPLNPTGLSGGGLWIVPNILKADDFYLDSISIEYYEKKSVVFATKMKQIISFIKETSKCKAKKNHVILPCQ